MKINQKILNRYEIVLSDALLVGQLAKPILELNEQLSKGAFIKYEGHKSISHAIVRVFNRRIVGLCRNINVVLKVMVNLVPDLGF